MLLFKSVLGTHQDNNSADSDKVGENNTKSAHSADPDKVGENSKSAQRALKRKRENGVEDSD